MENERKTPKTAEYNTPDTDTHAGQSKNKNAKNAQNVKNEQNAKDEQKGSNCR